jgi:Anaphase promoting complex subunit 8 / Cdc23
MPPVNNIQPTHPSQASAGGPGTSVDTSYSMLFSPGASSLASTPGGGNSQHYSGFDGGAGGMGGNNNNSSNMNIELEVHWDPSLVKTELLQASAVLSHRCLKYASNWAAAQMAGIPVGRAASFDGSHGGGGAPVSGCQILQEEFSNMNEIDWYAKSLVDLGEYLHAAAILSQQSLSSSSSSEGTFLPNPARTTANEITQIGPPTPSLSSYGFYLRAYALYMAGERRKEEDYVELQR